MAREIESDFDTWAWLLVHLEIMPAEERARVLAQQGLVERWGGAEARWRAVLQHDASVGEVRRVQRLERLRAIARGRAQPPAQPTPAPQAEGAPRRGSFEPNPELASTAPVDQRSPLAAPLPFQGQRPAPPASRFEPNPELGSTASPEARRIPPLPFAEDEPDVPEPVPPPFVPLPPVSAPAIVAAPAPAPAPSPRPAPPPQAPPPPPPPAAAPPPPPPAPPSHLEALLLRAGAKPEDVETLVKTMNVPPKGRG
jgi:hypothetical protein